MATNTEEIERAIEAAKRQRATSRTTPPPRQTAPQARSTVGAVEGFIQTESAKDKAKQGPSKPIMGTLSRIGDVVSQVEGVVAGVAKYQRARLEAAARGEMGWRERLTPDPRGLVEAGMEGWKQRTRYAEALEGLKGFVPLVYTPGSGGAPTLGLKTFEPGPMLDVIAPATLATPVSPPTRALMRVAKGEAKAFAKGAEAAIESLPKGKAVTELARETGAPVRAAFDQTYRLARKGIPGIQKIQSQHVGRVARIAKEKASELSVRAKKLVPDPQRMAAITKAIDQVPVKKPPNIQVAVKSTLEKVDGLSKRKAALDKRVSAIRDKGLKLESQLDSAIDKAAEKKLRKKIRQHTTNLDRTQREIVLIEESMQRLGENLAMLQNIDEMIRTGEYDRRLIQFRDRYNALAPNEKEAADLLRQRRDEIQLRKLEGKVLEEERATGVEQRIGYEWIPRRMVGRDQALEAVNRAIASEGPKPWLTRLKGNLEAMPRSPFVAMVRAARGKLVRQSFTKERKINRTLEEMGEAGGIFNHDMPAVLEAENLATARAIADRQYLAETYKYLDSLGLVHDVSEKATLGGKWKEFPSNYPGLPRGKMIEKEIADEVFPMLARSVDKEGFDVVYHMADRAMSIYRNWNLFVSPEYFVRNVVGNYFNNYVVHGMGISSLQDYAIAGKYNLKDVMGELTDDVVPLTDGMTEKQFFAWLEENRVISAGQTSESALDFLNAKPVSEISATDILNPTERNPLLRGGHWVQRLTENDARLAAFFYQRRHGKSLDEAIEGVYKSLFDYQLGLTQFERKHMRMLFPFYSWPRFNFPLQLEMLSQYPHRYLDIARLGRATEMTMGGPESNEAFYPEWLRESVSSRVHYDENTQTWYVLPWENWVPAAQLDILMNPKRWPKYIVDQIGPQKRPFEMTFNVDSFRSTPGNIRPLEYFPGETEKVLGMDVRKRYAGHALRTFRITRMVENVQEELKKDAPQKGLRSTMRLVVGKAQPVQRDESRQRFFKASDRRIGDLKSDLRYAKKRGDEKNVARIQREIDKEIELRRRAKAGGK